MPEPSHAPFDDPPPDPLMVGVKWWALGVVNGYHDRQNRGIGDGWVRYMSGWAQGMGLRHKGGTVDQFLTESQVPYREAHFRPRPPLVPGEQVRR